jgi:hypothetical protein
MSQDPRQDPVVVAFEDGTIDPARFDHRTHLYVAWCYLKHLEPEEALLRYVRHLRLLAAKLGVLDKYHATITWGYLVLLDTAMHDPTLAGASFDAVVAKYPSLLDRRALYHYYDEEELRSAEARRRFVLPRGRTGLITC